MLLKSRPKPADSAPRPSTLGRERGVRGFKSVERMRQAGAEPPPDGETSVMVAESSDNSRTVNTVWATSIRLSQPRSATGGRTYSGSAGYGRRRRIATTLPKAVRAKQNPTNRSRPIRNEEPIETDKASYVPCPAAGLAPARLFTRRRCAKLCIGAHNCTRCLPRQLPMSPR